MAIEKTPARQRLEQYRDNPRVAAFLDMLAATEGTIGIGNNAGYDVLFGGERFADLSKHPDRGKAFRDNAGRSQKSTAAGRYQMINPTWQEQAEKLGLEDFSAGNQDLAALGLIDQKGALDDIASGNITAAIDKLGSTWASLPSSKYPQAKRNMNFALQAYDSAYKSRTGSEAKPFTMPQQLSGMSTPKFMESYYTPSQTATPIEQRLAAHLGRPKLSIMESPLTNDTAGRLLTEAPVARTLGPLSTPQGVTHVGELGVNSLVMPGGMPLPPELADRMVRYNQDGRPMVAIPESYRDEELLSASQTSGIGINQLMGIEQELNRVRDDRVNSLFTKYPTVFDAQIGELIDFTD